MLLICWLSSFVVRGLLTGVVNMLAVWFCSKGVADWCC